MEAEAKRAASGHGVRQGRTGGRWLWVTSVQIEILVFAENRSYRDTNLTPSLSRDIVIPNMANKRLHIFHILINTCSFINALSPPLARSRTLHNYSCSTALVIRKVMCTSWSTRHADTVAMAAHVGDVAVMVAAYRHGC